MTADDWKRREKILGTYLDPAEVLCCEVDDAEANNVLAFLKGGTLARPTRGPNYSLDHLGSTKQVPFMTPILEEDREVSDEWKGVIKTFLSQASASYSSVLHAILINSSVRRYFSPLQRSLIILHEGHHGTFYSQGEGRDSSLTFEELDLLAELRVHVFLFRLLEKQFGERYSNILSAEMEAAKRTIRQAGGTIGINVVPGLCRSDSWRQLRQLDPTQPNEYVTRHWWQKILVLNVSVQLLAAQKPDNLERSQMLAIATVRKQLTVV